MELKGYQKQVILDLETYLDYVQETKRLDVAFNQYWEDRWGPYDPLYQTGMQPYKNNIPKAANVCIKVPTAGGKTFIAVNALKSIFRAYPSNKPQAVVWLVPWSNLLEQTVNNLSNPDHPYRRKLNSLFHHRVEVYEKKDLLQASNFNPSVVAEQLSIFVMSFASLRARKKEDRKTYQENGNLASFVEQYGSLEHLMVNTDETALINVIRSLNPVVVVDESHNAESDLSIDMLKALNPSFVLDLTATPKNNSNIVSMVPALELKKEHMVKLPVMVYNHHDKTEVINSALHLRHKLEALAIKQQNAGGKYIRPIVLFQAQPKTSEDNTTYEKLKAQLRSVGIPEEQIKIKTATIDELKGVDLMAESCPVRYIITINALKEGWDCPFAYILASLADKSSAVDVEQILGRVLRQPYVMKHASHMLNMSYVLTASARFHDTLQNIVKGLQNSGFSEKDYRKRDFMQKAEKENLEPAPPLELVFDQTRITYDPSLPAENLSLPSSIANVETEALEEANVLEEQVREQEESPIEKHIYSEMSEKVKTYHIRSGLEKEVKDVRLPQFFIKTPTITMFDVHGEAQLNQEILLKGFKLSQYDTRIDLDQIQSELYQVDLQESRKDDYTPSFTKIEEMMVKEDVLDYILAKPKEKQIKDIVYQLVEIIGSMYPIAEQEIKLYIQRVLESLSIEELREVLVRKLSYADKIKAKIKKHADTFAEERFEDWITVGKIEAKGNWKFPKKIAPGKLGPAIGKSLYEVEGQMNGFEIKVISEIASMGNVSYWHRNLGKGKGFAINGFKSNHYPDFILGTASGKIILLETKGDDRDNSDSEAKIRLGQKWAELAGKEYLYMMVFDKQEVKGAFSFDKAKELIRQM